MTATDTHRVRLADGVRLDARHAHRIGAETVRDERDLLLRRIERSRPVLSCDLPAKAGGVGADRVARRMLKQLPDALATCYVRECGLLLSLVPTLGRDRQWVGLLSQITPVCASALRDMGGQPGSETVVLTIGDHAIGRVLQRAGLTAGGLIKALPRGWALDFAALCRSHGACAGESGCDELWIPIGERAVGRCEWLGNRWHMRTVVVPTPGSWQVQRRGEIVEMLSAASRLTPARTTPEGLAAVERWVRLCDDAMAAPQRAAFSMKGTRP